MLNVIRCTFPDGSVCRGLCNSTGACPTVEVERIMKTHALNWRVWLMAGMLAAMISVWVMAVLLWWPRLMPRHAARSTELKTAQIGSTVLKPAETGSTELPDELTGDTARVNGVKCPVYRRDNGTYYALVGGERIDVEKVSGYERSNGNVVAGHYRTVADGSSRNNFSSDLHRVE